MGLASYEIVGSACEWRVSHDGKAENVYETKESAFEAAVATASLAIRQGHEVRITAPARAHSHGRSKLLIGDPRWQLINPWETKRAKAR
jgi:hypothetical protein